MLENGAPRCSEVEVWDHKLMDGGEIPKVVSPLSPPRKLELNSGPLCKKLVTLEHPRFPPKSHQKPQTLEATPGVRKRGDQSSQKAPKMSPQGLPESSEGTFTRKSGTLQKPQYTCTDCMSSSAWDPTFPIKAANKLCRSTDRNPDSQ